MSCVSRITNFTPKYIENKLIDRASFTQIQNIQNQKTVFHTVKHYESNKFVQDQKTFEHHLDKHIKTVEKLDRNELIKGKKTNQ